MKFKMFTALLLATLFMSFNTFAQGGFMAVANISKIHGVAYNSEKEKLKEGAEVSEGMIINMPKPGDFLEIKFQNGHSVRLVGAKVKVEKLDPKTTLFELIRGKIFSAIKPLTQNETYSIKTKAASFGVRGTQFMIEEGKKQTYLCVCEGVVSATTSKGSIDVKKDEDVTIAPKRELKATLATKNMVNMTKSVFNEMGIK